MKYFVLFYVIFLDRYFVKYFMLFCCVLFHKIFFVIFFLNISHISHYHIFDIFAECFNSADSVDDDHAASNWAGQARGLQAGKKSSHLLETVAPAIIA